MVGHNTHLDIDKEFYDERVEDEVWKVCLMVIKTLKVFITVGSRGCHKGN